MNLSEALEFVALTDVGRKREYNEDSIGADSAHGLTLVADGMGGHNAGEVASGIAINVIYEQLRAALPELNADTVDADTGFSAESMLVKNAIELANSAIMQISLSRTEYSGMGTTIVMGLFYDNRITIAHVGDSRMYRLRGKRFEQITRDHSLIQELVDQGFYNSMEEAEEAGNKNIITQALGLEDTVDVDISEEMVRANDIYLLCSDGLTDMVSDEDIHLTLNKFSADLSLAAEKLTEMANENGGKDNISIALARPTQSFALKKSWYRRLLG